MSLSHGMVTYYAVIESAASMGIYNVDADDIMRDKTQFLK